MKNSGKTAQRRECDVIPCKPFEGDRHASNKMGAGPGGCKLGQRRAGRRNISDPAHHAPAQIYIIHFKFHHQTRVSTQRHFAVSGLAGSAAIGRQALPRRLSA